MRKKIIAVLAIILAAIIISLGINSGVANASPVVIQNPRVYCVNEPIKVHGRYVPRISCVSMAFRGTGR